MPSITSWIRLEPRWRDDEMTEAVQARIYDPLWMLARQWQTGEFQGEDTGSPVARPLACRQCVAHALLRRRDQGEYARQRAALRRAVRCRSKHSSSGSRFAATPTEGSLRLAVESGMHFLRMLDAQPTSRSYRGDFISRFALQPPTDAQRPGLDAETLSYWNLMALRVPDARRLLAAFVDAQGRRIAVAGCVECRRRR